MVFKRERAKVSEGSRGVAKVEEAGNSSRGGFRSQGVAAALPGFRHAGLSVANCGDLALSLRRCSALTLCLHHAGFWLWDVSHSSSHSCVREYVRRVGASRPPKNSSHTCSPHGLRLSQLCSQSVDASCGWTMKVLRDSNGGYVFALGHHL